MNLTEQEYKEAQKYINKWEKFVKHWPMLRWVVLCLLLLCITTAIMEFSAFYKMNKYNTHHSILGDGVVPEDIGTYVDSRMNLLRAENKYYIGFLICGFTATLFFLTIISGWNRHKYISTKVKIFKELLEQRM